MLAAGETMNLFDLLHFSQIQHNKQIHHEE
jgi:hypothetical protein